MKRETAERVYNLLEPWEINETGETVESTLQLMEAEPEAAIEFLLDIIDNLTA